jgi:two-component system response regulator
MGEAMPPTIDILLVEDNPYDVKLTFDAFREHRMENRIHVARDGAEAIDFIFAEGPHRDREGMEQPKLILLDLKLPLVDGLEVLRRIKGDDRTRTIPVVVLTSSAEGPDITESYQLGANSYIVKPVDYEQFVKAVRDLGLYWLLLNRSPENGGLP